MIDGAKAVWDRLVDGFEVKSVQNTMILRTEINQMKLKEGGSVKEHLRNMKELCNRLAMLDDQVSEKDQLINLLASLMSSYSALRTGSRDHTDRGAASATHGGAAKGEL